jgi:hypothetical protein
MTDGQMTDTERALVVQLLRQTQEDFLSAVERLTDAQWDFRPAAPNGRSSMSRTRTGRPPRPGRMR